MTGDRARRDESIRFSLSELQRLEDERLSTERQEREARHLAEVNRVAEERRTEALRAEERAKACARGVEEEARREAMSRAAVEQARIAVDARARAEEVERERRYDIERLTLRAEGQKRMSVVRLLASGASGAALSMAVCSTLFFTLVKPETDRRINVSDRGLADAEMHARDLSSRDATLREQVETLEGKLKAAEAELARRPVIVPPPIPALTSTPKRGGVMAPSPPKPSGVSDPCAGSSDPLCGLDLRRPR